MQNGVSNKGRIDHKVCEKDKRSRMRERERARRRERKVGCIAKPRLNAGVWGLGFGVRLRSTNRDSEH